MTTRVQIVLPIPNHKRVRVDVIDVAEAGTETVIDSQELDHGQVSRNINGWDGRVVRITEID